MCSVIMAGGAKSGRMKTKWAKTTAVITGASRGLGAALATELANRGVRVVLVARHEEPLRNVVAALRRTGATAHAIVADIADKDATWRIAGEAQALVGPIDLLVHNASTLGPVPLRPLLDTDCEALESVLQTNVVGPFRLSKALVGPMVMREQGTVVQISSDAALEAYPSWGAYGASKAAADHLTRVLAAELSKTGVRFLAVDPGEMRTQMHHDAMPDADPSTLTDPAVVARRIVTLLEDATVGSGSRVAASSFSEAGPAASGFRGLS